MIEGICKKGHIRIIRNVFDTTYFKQVISFCRTIYKMYENVFIIHIHIRFRLHINEIQKQTN